MSLIQALSLLLIAAHLLGGLTHRLHLSELLGQLLAGVLLGPMLLNWVQPSASVSAWIDVAVLMVVISAGLETRLADIVWHYRPRHALALLPSLLVPVGGAWLVAAAFAHSSIACTVIALCIAVTALPVALRILSDFGLQRTPLAQLTIASALLGDVLVLLALSALSPLAQQVEAPIAKMIGLNLLKLAALLVLVVICTMLHRRLHRTLLRSQSQANLRTSAGLLVILLLAAAANMLNLHFAIGAFVGALIVSEPYTDMHHRHPLRAAVDGATQWWFAPLFLAYQGTQLNAQPWTQPWFTLCLLLIAVAGKLLGGYWSARSAGLSTHEARGVGMVMNARGVMGMLVANIAWREGLIDAGTNSALLMVSMATTLLTPILLQSWQHAALTAPSPRVGE
jgi:Kef-type K+ transport system membrane component KefB